eukprot:UN34342
MGLVVENEQTKKPRKHKHNSKQNQDDFVKEEPTVKTEKYKDDTDDIFDAIPDWEKEMYKGGADDEMTHGNEQVAAKAQAEQNQQYEPNDTNWSRVHVGGLAPGTKWRELSRAFHHCGKVKYVQVLENRGYGFITFCTQQEAKNAIQDMNGRNFKGQPITVSWARDRINNPNHYRGRGGRRGGPGR